MKVLDSANIYSVGTEFNKGLSDDVNKDPEQALKDIDYNLNTRLPAATTAALRSQALQWAAYDLGQLVGNPAYGAQDLRVAPLLLELAGNTQIEEQAVVAAMDAAIASIRAGQAC
jgi:hypothetical protein